MRRNMIQQRCRRDGVTHQEGVNQVNLAICVQGSEAGRVAQDIEAADPRYTGARTINRPCAQQDVGKSQSCMVISKWTIHCTRTRIATALLLVLDRLRATDRLRQPTNPTVASSTTALRG